MTLSSPTRRPQMCTVSLKSTISLMELYCCRLITENICPGWTVDKVSTLLKPLRWRQMCSAASKSTISPMALSCFRQTTESTSVEFVATAGTISRLTRITLIYFANFIFVSQVRLSTRITQARAIQQFRTQQENTNVENWHHCKKKKKEKCWL